MNQMDQYKGQKKQWEKPQLFNLSIDAYTKTGFLGPSVDFTSTSATNTASS